MGLFPGLIVATGIILLWITFTRVLLLMDLQREPTNSLPPLKLSLFGVTAAVVLAIAALTTGTRMLIAFDGGLVLGWGCISVLALRRHLQQRPRRMSENWSAHYARNVEWPVNSSAFSMTNLKNADEDDGDCQRSVGGLGQHVRHHTFILARIKPPITDQEFQRQYQQEPTKDDD